MRKEWELDFQARFLAKERDWLKKYEEQEREKQDVKEVVLKKEEQMERVKKSNDQMKWDSIFEITMKIQLLYTVQVIWFSIKSFWLCCTSKFVSLSTNPISIESSGNEVKIRFANSNCHEN